MQKPYEVSCVIQVDHFFYVAKNLSLTKDIKKALTIFGRKRAKRMALILQENGMQHVKVMILKNV